MIAIPDENEGGPRGPVLHVPAGWLLAVTHGSNPHAKRKYAMLLQMAAKVAAGGIECIDGDESDMYGQDFESDSEPYIKAAIDQLKKEGYIVQERGSLKLSEKTRRLFALEEPNDCSA